MEKSIAGYAAGFLKIMNLPPEAFHPETFRLEEITKES